MTPVRIPRPRLRPAALTTLLCAGALLCTALSAPRARASENCAPDTGPYQLVAEEHLGLPQDGVTSPADCAAVQDLQIRHGFEPANGRAGIETWRIIQYEKVLADPSSLTGCPHGTELAVCVDLNRQVLWVWDGGRVAFGPVPIRTGKPGYATRTGSHRIYSRVEQQWSELYEGPMPFSQFFDGGQALHASYRNIWEEPGSHGCVNLRYDEAKRLWQALRNNDLVHVWGERGA
jgi:hypothetical protein